MTKRVAIVQSNYIPWKGYFDIINSVDEFILYDDMQYTRRDWRNRNRIKTPSGAAWLTIPVEVARKYYQKIKDTVISNQDWNRAHWMTICSNYARARYFGDYRAQLESLYLDSSDTHLSAVNYKFLTTICAILDIPTKLSWSMDYHLMEGRSERLIDICHQAHADEYISGPAAKDYLDEELFKQARIKLTYMNYSGYLEYSQLFPPFEHSVSIIDLILNEGPNARIYMKS